MATPQTPRTKTSRQGIDPVIAAIRALEEAMAAKDKPIPVGWFSARQFAEAKGTTEHSARERLKDACGYGIMERQPWKAGRGKFFIYRLANKP
jgi:hypothetical protein